MTLQSLIPEKVAVLEGRIKNSSVSTHAQQFGKLWDNYANHWNFSGDRKTVALTWMRIRLDGMRLKL